MGGRKGIQWFFLLLFFFLPLCSQAQDESEWIPYPLYHLTVKVPPGWYPFFGESFDELGGFIRPLWPKEPPPDRQAFFAQADVFYVLRGETAQRFESDLRASDPALQEEALTVGGYSATLIRSTEEGPKLFFAFIRSEEPLAFLFSLTQSGEPEIRAILQRVSIGKPPYFLDKILGMNVLDAPQGLTCDREGNVYVAGKNHQILVFNPRGEELSTIGKEGTADGELLNPSGITLSPEGYLYVADAVGRIQKFDRKGQFLGMLAEGLNKPSGLACDQEGNVYVVETGASRVTKWSPEGKRLLVFGNPEELSFSDSFAGVALGKNGEVFVSDPGHNRVLVFDSTGQVLRSIYRVPQVKGIYLSGNDGFPQEPPPFAPCGLAVDTWGRLYVADQSSATLLRFRENGALEVVWKRLEGQRFTFPDNTLGAINGVAVDSSGTVYAARALAPYALFAFTPTTKEPPPPLDVTDIRPVSPKATATPPPLQDQETTKPGEKTSPEEEIPENQFPPQESPVPTPVPPLPTPTPIAFTLTVTPQETEFETGKTVRFVATLNPLPENPVRYVWNFGDGTTPRNTDENTVEHQFGKPGNITLTVKAFDAVTKEMLAMKKVTLSLKSSGPALLTHEERYPNGNVKLRYTYYVGKDGNRVKHGSEVSFYENGKKKVEGEYVHGKKEGTWISYYDNGNIGQKGTYRNNRKEGTWTIYYRNGQKESEGPYRQDKREGKWTKWLPDGKKFAEMEYRGDKIVPGSYREF